MTGWAKDTGGNYAIDKASVYVGSTFVKDINYGLSRPDKGGNYGFNGGIDLRSWAGQKVNITVRLTSGAKIYDLVSSGVTVVPTAPSAPSGLTSTGKTTSTISLSWADNSSNETGFKVRRNGTVVGAVAANATTYTDTGLSANTTYIYTVCATNAGGDSSDSNSIDVTTDATSSDTITMSCRTVSVGGSATIEVTIRNPGAGSASNVVIDMVQLGAAKAADVPWSIGTLAGGATSIKNFTFPEGFGSNKATLLTVNARIGTKKVRLRVKVSAMPG